MTRALLLALLAVLLAAGVFLWSASDRRSPGSSPPTPPEPEAGADAAPDPSGAPIPYPTADRGSSGPARIATEPADVSLASRGALVVRVLTADGLPAPEVPIVLARIDTEEERVQDSGADGRAAFDGARRDVLDDAEGRYELRLRLPLAEPPRLALTHALARVDEVSLALPPTGEVEVRVFDQAGRAPTGDWSATLALIGEEESLDPTLAFERPSWLRPMPDDGGGPRALFRHVELGRRWEAVVSREPFDVPSRARADGPLRAGERIVVDVTSGADHPVLVFRAVDVTGRVLRESELTLERYSFFGSLGTSTVTTDADGRFEVDVEASWLAGGSLLVRQELEDGRELSGYGEVDGDLDPGRHPRGDIVLVPDEVLVTGRVSRRDGGSHSGAQVFAGRNANFREDLRFDWGPNDVEGTSAPDGTFTLRGKHPDQVFQVWAYDGDWRSTPVQARAGEHVELVLEPYWEVRGRLSVDAGVPMRFGLTLRGEELHTGTVEVDPEGRFRMDRVPTGRYDFVVTSGDVELVRHEGLAVDRDLDLGAVDLSGKILRHEVVLVGPEVEQGQLRWRPCGGDDSWAHVDFTGNEVALHTPRECIDLQLVVPGYRTEDLTNFAGRVSVTLVPAIRVRLVLRTDGQLPEPPYVFGPRPYQGNDVIGTADGTPYFTEQNREVVFLLARHGRVRVAWHLERRTEGLSIGANVLSNRDVWIDVHDQSGEQLYVLDLDGAALTALVESPPF